MAFMCELTRRHMGFLTLHRVAKLQYAKPTELIAHVYGAASYDEGTHVSAGHSNYLINARHPDVHREVKLIGCDALPFDPRL